MTTENGIHLIEDFMNIKAYWNPDVSQVITNVGIPGLPDDHVYFSNWKETLFHKSLDWQLPVLEKIRSLNPDNGKLWFEFEIHACHCRIWSNQEWVWKNNAGTTIKAVFDTIVQFIEWYNTQKQK